MKRDVYLNNQPLEEALENFMRFMEEEGALKPGAPEMISVEDALDRVTAMPVYARISSPHYNASAMDGVAVLAAKTIGASEKSPRQLKVDEDFTVVDTGDLIPPHCDAVIMIEDINYLDKETIEIIAAVSPWQHVRLIGEDVVATEMILPGNHQLRPADIGAILAGGITETAVHPRPRVALMPTGTELVQPGSDLRPGNIIEYNTRVFGAMVRQWGGVPVRREITVDDYGLLKETMLSAVEEADILLINAGSSAGREDFTSSLISELGIMLTHGVAIKPGKPTILGIIKGKPVIGVPGYPVSAMLCMDLFVKPIIFRKQGMLPPPVPKTEAIVSRKIVSPLGMEEFVRVKLGRVGEKIMATPISRGAGVIMSMVRADGMLRVPRTSEGFNAAEAVQVELQRSLDEVLETTVVIGSHDIALDVLGNYLRQNYPQATLSSAHVGSLGGLTALKRGEAHCAGTHLLDEDTGDYNVSYIKRLLPDKPCVLVNLVYREQGLILAPDNPKAIHGLEDLTKKEVIFINRQRGAGTRVLLDYKLKELAINPASIVGYDREEYTHMAVAAAVAGGSADAGLGIRAAAQALGLEFISVVEERYDLCIPKEFWDTPYIQRLLEVIKLQSFRDAVHALGGYDLRDCGKIMWEQD